MGSKENLAVFRLLEDKGRCLLFEKISENPNITRERLSEMVARDKADIAADVQVMVALDLMANRGNGDDARYELTPYGENVMKALSI